MKYVVLGWGSIGHRHTQNLHRLRPDAQIVIADPLCIKPGPGQLFYRDWQRALSDHGDAAGVIIASPTAEHAEQLAACLGARMACYVEKPVVAAGDSTRLRYLLKLSATVGPLMPGLLPTDRCVVGYQYLFHEAMPTVARLARQYGELTFAGQDTLVERYGRDVEGIMTAHPIASALRLFGPAFGVHLYSDGVRLSGHIFHQGGGVSHYDFAMDRGPRESWVRAGGRDVALTADDGMYSDCLGAWISWIEGGERDTRLSSLAEGLEVTRVLAQVQRVEAMV